MNRLKNDKDVNNTPVSCTTATTSCKHGESPTPSTHVPNVSPNDTLSKTSTIEKSRLYPHTANDANNESSDIANELGCSVIYWDKDKSDLPIELLPDRILSQNDAKPLNTSITLFESLNTVKQSTMSSPTGASPNSLQSPSLLTNLSQIP